MRIAMSNTSFKAVVKRVSGVRPRSGYTLIELLISISIFGIITGIMVWNFDRSNRNEDLRYAAENLAADLRLVQNMAMTGATIQDPDDLSTATPIGGYGLHIDTDDPTSYQLFADRERLNPETGDCESIRNGRLDRLIDLSHNCLWMDGNDDILMNEAVRLPREVEIDSLTVDWWDEPDPISIVDIAFVPPKPIPIIGVNDIAVDNEARVGTIEIGLVHSVTQMHRRITLIGASGQVSVTTP